MPKAQEFKRHTYVPNRFYDFVERMNQAMAGDMQFRITPAVITGTPPTAAAWQRDVLVELVNAAGDVHEWFDATFAVGIGIANTSIAGTAGLIDSTGAVGTVLTFVDGAATVQVTGDAAAWLGGTRQVGTSTVTAGATNSGTLTMRFTTGAGNLDFAVPVGAGDTVSDVAARIADAFNANAATAAIGTAVATVANIVITANDPAANDGAWAFTVNAADGTLVTMGALGATTAGVAPETVTFSCLQQTIMGTVVAAVTQVETFITPA